MRAGTLLLVSLGMLGPVSAATAQWRYLEAPAPGADVRLPDGWLEANREAAKVLGIPFGPDAGRTTTAAGIARAEGTLPILVLLALFSDSPEPTIQPEDVSAVLFDGPADPGTLVEYYSEVSGGRLQISGQVTPWVRTNVTLLDAAGSVNGHGVVGDSIRAYVKQAIVAADPSVDYGAFDNDGPDGIPNSGDDDGVVDALIIEFLEPAGSCNGPGIWPHISALSRDPDTPFPTSDVGPDGAPIGAQVYIAESASACSGTQAEGPATAAHELGHLLGLGDTYVFVDGIEPQFRHWNVGCFAIMAAGSWGCGTGFKAERVFPPHVSLRNKVRLEWAVFEEVPPEGESEYLLAPVQSESRGLRVPLGPISLESFLIEYRPRTGFDVNMPAGGVLIYHLDATIRPDPLSEGSPPPWPVHLVEADGDHALRKLEAEGGNRGVPGDVFSTDGAEVVLTNFTTPSLRDHDGRVSLLDRLSVRVEVGGARVRVSYRPIFGLAGEHGALEGTVLSPFRLEYDVVGAFGIPQVVTEGLPVGLTFALEDTTLVLSGVPRQAGEFPVRVQLTDEEAQTDETTLTLTIDDLAIDPLILLAAVLETESDALSAEQRAYLDLSGNDDGAFDLGDMRAALIRRGILSP